MNQEELVNKLIQEKVLKNPKVIQAFLANDRKDFVPEDLRNNAYVDAPLLIGSGQTISQPWTVAFMLELLEPRAGQKILDVGFGSGWTAAILASIAGEQGKVYGLEIGPEVFEFGKSNLERQFFPLRNSTTFFPPQAWGGWPKAGRGRTVFPSSALRSPSPARGEGNNVDIIRRGIEGEAGSVAREERINNIMLFLRSGWEGLPEYAPFDRILVSAASPEVPEALQAQLAIGGRMVIPVGESFGSTVKLLKKISRDTFTEEDYPGFAFVPLIKKSRY